MEEEAVGEGEGVEMSLWAGLEWGHHAHRELCQYGVYMKLQTLFLSILVLLLLCN